MSARIPQALIYNLPNYCEALYYLNLFQKL